jgi:hypothetical protein
MVNFAGDDGELIGVGMRKGSSDSRLRRLRMTTRLRDVHLMLATWTEKELRVERSENDRSQSAMVLR